MPFITSSSSSSHRGILRIFLACTFLFPSTVTAQNRQFPLRLLPTSTAAAYGAKCLDGSLPGYYYRPASDPASANKWKIHFRGGGWCFDAPSCYSRSFTPTGSSNYFPIDIYNSTDAPYGFMDDNTTNPFGSYNAVFVPYCDGSSWSSSRTDPVIYNNTEIWLRGHNNLLALLNDLTTVGNFLDQATEVVITGTSAGGMTTALFTGYIKSQLRSPNPFVVALMDAGWWWNAENVKGSYAFAAGFQEAYGTNFWNTTDGNTLLPVCAAALPVDQQWNCMLPDYVYNETYTNIDGVFVMQSLYDSAQLGMELQIGCDPFSTCNSAQLQEIQNYRTIFEERILQHQTFYGERDGHFLTACYQHEETCRDRDWYGILITDNTTNIQYSANQTFTAWYTQTKTKVPSTTPTRLIDVVWPNNPSCAPESFHHGGC